MALTARMTPRLAFVSLPVVARRSSHQLLRVLGLDVFEDDLSAPPAQRGGDDTAMADHDRVTPDDIVETIRTGRGRSVVSAP